MKQINPQPKSPPPETAIEETPVIGAGPDVTPEAAAVVANHLPKREQLKEFEKDLEEHDSGNQPA